MPRSTPNDRLVLARDTLILFKIFRIILIVLPWVLLFLTVKPLEANAPITNEITDSSDGVLISNSPIPTKQKVFNTTTGNCEQYRHLVEQYDWDTDLMLEIMRLESSCKSFAVGDTTPIRGVLAPSCGLLQIRTLKGRPDCETLKDPATNIEWGYKIYTTQGYNAWTVYRNMR